MLSARLAGRVFATCALAASVACATDRDPTGIEYSARLALTKPGGDVQFGTTADDAAYAIAVDKLGVAVVGATAGALDGQSNAGGHDAFVRLYDKRGALVWTRQFGTGADDRASGVAMDRNGLYVAGSTSGSLGPANLGASDGFVSMFDANGSLVWMTRLASAGADSAFGVAVDRDAVYVTGELRGQIEGTTVDNADGYVVKLDARTGQILWMTRFAGTSGGNDGARGRAGRLVGATRYSLSRVPHDFQQFFRATPNRSTVAARCGGARAGSGYRERARAADVPLRFARPPGFARARAGAERRGRGAAGRPDPVVEIVARQ